MAGISTDKQGRRRIFFTDQDGNRKSVRLGKVPKKIADEVCGRIEAILAAKSAHTSFDRETAAWIAAIGGDLAEKLAAVGLIESRERTNTTLGEWLAAYVAKRTDVSNGTRLCLGIVKNRILAYFPGQSAMRAITEGQADDWVIWLKSEYAGPTVSKSIKVARQFWSQAIRDGAATVNPFSHLKAPSEVNTARAFFVDEATFTRVLEACPDSQWRLLLALARYGGLRTPSEPLSLSWADVNWEKERFRVVAPKTKHHDGGERWVPIFPRLKPFLEESFELAEPGTIEVITRWRDSRQNLRTGFQRILRKAGVKAWPRLYQNLRASLETELAEKFPIHVAAEWLGNSPVVAMAHYTQTTEEHYARAVRAVQNPAQQGAANATQGTATEKGHFPDCEALQGFATSCDSVQVNSIAAMGFEPIRGLLPKGF